VVKNGLEAQAPAATAYAASCVGSAPRGVRLPLRPRLGTCAWGANLLPWPQLITRLESLADLLREVSADEPAGHKIAAKRLYG
jgi:hypothetical protein